MKEQNVRGCAQTSITRVCCILLAIAGCLSARAATYTWNGSISSDWFNPTNWTPAGVPGTGDTANVSGTVNLSAAVVFNGQFNWSGGTLSGNSLTITNGGVLDITGNANLECPLTNYGTVNWQAGTVEIYNYGPDSYTGEIWNQSGALWDILCDQNLNYFQSSGTNIFNNAGLVRKDAGTNTTTINVGFINSGTVNVPSGIVSFGGGETNLNGNFVSATNAGITGNLSGTFSGSINWLGGQVEPGQPLAVASNGTLNILGDVNFYSPLTNYGTVNWTAGTISIFNYSPNSYTGDIWNQSGALWDILCDQSVTSGDSGGTYIFNNAGLLRKDAGTNTTTVSVAFVNSGTVNVPSGTIAFNGGETNLNGNFVSAPNAGITGYLSGTFSGSINWLSGQTPAGQPLTVANGGTLNILGGVNFYGPLTNYGTVNWQNGTITLFNYSTYGYNGEIWNQSGALWDILCDQTLTYQYNGTNIFNNAGLVRKDAGTNTTTMGVSFVNSGTVDVPSGIISFSGGETNLNGSFQSGPNAGISGYLSGTITGTLNWISPATSPGQPLTVASNAVLNILGSMSIYSPLTNYGTVNWMAGTITIFNYAGYGYNGEIWNQSGALWDILCDQTLTYQYGGTNMFNNAGLVRKDAGTNTSTMGVSFVNSGTVDAENGTIQFNDGGALTGTLQAEAGAVINFSGGNFLLSGTVNSQGAGAVWVNGGNISGTYSGTVNLAGGGIPAGQPLTVANGGTLNILGGVNFYGPLTNYGTVNWRNGEITIYNYAGYGYNGQIWNQSGALWDILCDQTLTYQYGGTNLFNNAGLMRKDAGTNTTTVGVGFVNSGTVDAENGTIQFNDGGALTGTLQAEAGAEISFASGNFSLSGAANSQGAGAVWVNGGTISGTYSGTINLAGGGIPTGVPLTVASNGVLNILGSVTVAGPLTNYGTVNWQAGTITIYNYTSGGENGEIWNEPGALWDILCDQSLTYYTGGTNVFNNAGLVRKDAGTNTTTVSVSFVNTGTVDAENGTISFSTGETNANAVFESGPSASIGGYLSGTFSGTINWVSPEMASQQPLTVASNGVLNILGSVTVAGPLTNYGTVNWQAGTITIYNYTSGGENGEIWNEPGALWDILCDQSLTYYTGGTNVFNNAGLVRKDAGTNTTTVSVNFTNMGTVTAVEGTIGFDGGISLTNGLLDFAVSSSSNYGTISISGAADLAGGVGAILLNGYVPTAGTQFNVMSFGSTNGMFTDYSGLNVGGGIYFNALVSSTALTLQASATNFVAVSPSFIRQPVGEIVTYGGTATFSAEVSGTPPLTYEWSLNGNPVAATTNATLTLTNVQVSQAGSYTLLVSNSASSLLSQPAVLTVLQATPVVTWSNPAAITYGTALGGAQLDASANVPGTFSYNPPAGTVPTAGTAALSVTFYPSDTTDYTTATGGVNLTVSKVPLTVTANNASRTFGQTNPVFTGTIVGLTNHDNITAAYSCSAVPSSPQGTYSIVPSLVDPNGRQGNYSITLSNGTLTVSPGPPPTLTGVLPVVGPTNGGTTVTLSGTGFEVGATVGFGGLPASSVNVLSPSNLTANIPASPVGTVNIILTNTDGTAVTLTNAFTYGIPPNIQTQPANQSVPPGTNVQFQVAATGATPLTYQWEYNGTPMLDYGGISGSHTSTLSLSNVAANEVGTYTVVITNLYGTATSSGAALTVLVPPSITTQPQGLAVGVGANVSLSVTASGTQPLGYQWRQNGTPLGGGTSATLNISDIQSADQGSYTVVVTNLAGTITSAPATVTVLNYCASAQTGQSLYPVGTTVPIAVQTFACNSSTPSPNASAVVWIYEAGLARNFPVTTDGSGNATFNFTPLPGEAGLCQFAATLPGLSAPSAQGSFTLVGMSLSTNSLNAPLIVGVPQTNIVTLSNLTSVGLSGISGAAVGGPGNISVQVSAPSTLGGNATAQATVVFTATGPSPAQSQFSLQFTSSQNTTNTVTVNASATSLVPQLVATPASLSGTMVTGGQTLISFNLNNTGGAASGPVQVLLPTAPWLSVATPSTIASLAPGASSQVTLALTPAANQTLGHYTGAVELIGSNSQAQVPFNFNCVSSQEGSLQITVQDELSIYGEGNPNVSNATITVNDFVTGTNVASVMTGQSGIVLLSNLTSAYYTVAVAASGHGNFSTTLLVQPNQTNDLTAFLPLDLVDYTWVVTPTTVADNYEFTLQTTFQTQVPWPVVTINPGAINLCSVNGSSSQMDLVITNSGLIAAQGLQLVVGTHTNWALTPLATNLGDLGPETNITLPMMINQIGSSTNADSTIAAQLNWHVDTPTQSKYYSTPIFIYNANPNNCVISSTPVLPPPPVVQAPPDTPGEVDTNAVGSDGDFSGGGGGGGGGGGSAGSPYISSPSYNFSLPVTGALVDVVLQINQRAVISRDGFSATLQLNNNSGSSISDVLVSVTPQDASGNPAGAMFGIPAPALTGGLNAVDGTGTMAVGASGTATWTIVPTTNAAPTNSVQYAVGGTLSYVLNGQQVTIPLFPVPITVLPCPILNVDYFLQHDVYGDDPFTPQIEPSIPFGLGILVKNAGYGDANNFTITSAQPQIVQNSNDLLISFELIGSQVGTNQSISPSLTLNLGNIGPQGASEGLWYMISSLEGEFVDFTASFKHVDDFGNTNTSLINQLRTHEMEHVVEITVPSDDGVPDFLVNDSTNVDALPDIVYSSDGTTSPVTSITSGTTMGAPSGTNSTITLTVSVPTGWVYLEVVDPGAGAYPILGVQRSDGTNLLVGPNVWQTPERIHMVPAQDNNLIHIFDYNSTGSYTVTYGLPVTPPVATTLDAVNVTPTNATLNATVNPDGATTQVYFQWGRTTNYSNTTAMSTLSDDFYTTQAVTLAVGGLLPNTTYHYQVVAANSAGTAYGQDATLTTPPLPPPTITQVSNQTAVVGQFLNFTNSAQAATPPVTFVLGAPAPQGATITSNGVFTWQPDCEEGGTTNNITVWAIDSGTPPLSNSMTFTVVVGQCTEVSVGSAVMQAGQTTNIPVTLISSEGITNLSFTLATLPGRFTNWTFTSTNTTIAMSNVQTSGRFPVITLVTQTGQVLNSPSVLGNIGFTALGGPSVFAPVAASNILGIETDGSEVGNITGQPGRVVVIGVQPLLQAGVSNGTPILTLYGNPGSNYEVGFSTNLSLTNWQNAGSVLMTNLQQNFDVNLTTPQLYYQVR